jgi:hypothetical protein
MVLHLMKTTVYLLQDVSILNSLVLAAEPLGRPV